MVVTVASPRAWRRARVDARRRARSRSVASNPWRPHTRVSRVDRDASARAASDAAARRVRRRRASRDADARRTIARDGGDAGDAGRAKGGRGLLHVLRHAGVRDVDRVRAARGRERVDPEHEERAGEERRGPVRERGGVLRGRVRAGVGRGRGRVRGKGRVRDAVGEV